MTEAHASPDARFEDASDDTHLDGNAVAGDLLEVFAVDMTMSTWTCRACGHAAPLARARVYGRTPGLVVRCEGCAGVLATIVSTRTERILDLPGVSRVHVPRTS